MDRQQIIDLYEWSTGVCFRHPARGKVATTVVGAIHPQPDATHEVRACVECVVNMEDIRREDAARSGGQYEPGHLGDVLR